MVSSSNDQKIILAILNIEEAVYQCQETIDASSVDILTHAFNYACSILLTGVMAAAIFQLPLRIGLETTGIIVVPTAAILWLVFTYMVYTKPKQKAQSRQKKLESIQKKLEGELKKLIT